MAPQVATSSTPRGRGRPRKNAAQFAAVTEAPKRRGRVPKAVAPVEAEPQPKKRGRAVKTPIEEAPAEVDVAAEEPQKRVGRGRPRKEPAVEDAPAKRGGRPRKQEAIQDAPTTPKRKGRPPKSAVDLHRVAGAPRVGKRTSPRAKPTKTAAAPAARLDPRVRSRLRSRAPPVEKKAPVVTEAPTPKKRMGRPPKKEATVAPNTKKARVTKPATKPSVPRKRRGITTIEVPDRFAQIVKDFVDALLQDAAAETSEAEPAQSDVEEEGAAPMEEDSVAIGDGINGSNEIGGLTEEQIEAREAQDIEETEELEQDIADASKEEGGLAPIAQGSPDAVNGNRKATTSSDGDQNGSSNNGRAKDVTEEVVIHEVEVEMEIDEAFDEPHESAVDQLLSRQQITEEISELPAQPADEPESLFDGTIDGSFVAQVSAAIKAPVAQVSSTFFS
jgi:hypothetical protein